MILYTQICVWDHPWDPKNINIVRGDCYLKDPFQTKSTTFNLSRFRKSFWDVAINIGLTGLATA
jgi:hypothetical protein